MTEMVQIKDFPGYFISRGGMLGSIRKGFFQVKKPTLNPHGYLHVSLQREGKQHLRRIHRLVALAFIPKIPGKICVNHKNGVQTDNAAENLEWVSDYENKQHALFVLGRNFGPKHQPLMSKKERVFTLSAQGKSQTEIAKELGVHPSGVSRLLRRVVK